MQETAPGGQFDWGGRLRKGNGGAQRSPQAGWKSAVERIGIRGLDCEAYKPNRDESRAKLPYGSVWKGRGLSDKSYPGDNRLISPKRSQRRGGLAPRCRLVASWGWSRSQGLGCSPIKAARELVQNVVRQFGLYPQWAQETCEELPLVREDWGGRTSGVRVVPPGAKSPVAMSGRDKR